MTPKFTSAFLSTQKRFRSHWWFVVHSGLFGLVILLTLLNVMNTIQSPQKGQDIGKICLSEITASWLVAIQFAFPFLSACSVTRGLEQMYGKSTVLTSYC